MLSDLGDSSEYQKLQNLINNLQKSEPFVLKDDGTRRASVVILIRAQQKRLPFSEDNIQKVDDLLHCLQNKDFQLQMMFIQRAQRQNDRWSGQVSFVGGMKSLEDKNDYETAVRETQEELGIDLNDSAKFLFLGQLDDRPAFKWYSNDKLLILSPFIFFYFGCNDLQMKPNPKEVQYPFWVPITHNFEPLMSIDIDSNSFHQITQQKENQFGWTSVQLDLLAKTSYHNILPSCLIGFINFPAIKLQKCVSDEVIIDDQRQYNKYERVLWVLTLSVVSDFMDLLYQEGTELKSINTISAWISPTIYNKDTNFYLNTLNRKKGSLNMVGRRRFDQHFNWSISIKHAFIYAWAFRIAGIYLIYKGVRSKLQMFN